jgi:hypothetical protein
MKLRPKPGQYDIGYGKPPVSTRFQKGHSGNPKGRPKKVRGLDESIAEKLDDLVCIHRDGRAEWVTKRELGIIVLVRHALGGKIAALRKVFAYIRQMEPPPDKAAFRIEYVPDPPETVLAETMKEDERQPAKDKKRRRKAR